MLSAKSFVSGRLAPSQEAAFFAALRLANGTFKTTADHRMDDLNDIVVARWSETDFRPSEILDLGASSGISTLEWQQSLNQAGFKVRLTATDLSLRARIVRLWPGFDVVESSGCVLQHIILGVPVRPWNRRLDYVTGYVLLSRLANLVAARRLRAMNGQPCSADILLVSQRALRNEQIVWAEDDVLAPNPEKFIRRFGAIRAANILNCDYFNAAQLQCAVRNVRDRLVGPGAVLIVNRTSKDGSNHATLFRLGDNSRFAVDVRLGRGSEIDDVVLNV